MKELDVPLLTKEEAEAIKALAAGKADERQQLLSVAVIVNKFSMDDALCYFPGDSAAGAFAAGRTFVGKRLKLFIKLPFADLKDYIAEAKQ